MKTFHQLLLGAGLLVPGPAAEAQRRTDYTGTWLNTATYTQSVGKLKISHADRWAPNLLAWEGLPANPTRRSLGYLWAQPGSGNPVTRLGLRRVTADVAETYLLDLQPDGALRVLRHVAQAGRTVRCDTMRFERRQHGGMVRKRDARRAARRTFAPPEATLCYAPASPTSANKLLFLALGTVHEGKKPPSTRQD